MRDPRDRAHLCPLRLPDRRARRRSRRDGGFLAYWVIQPEQIVVLFDLT